jgi:hypothetical protein
VHLASWDGKALTLTSVLENNKAAVTALAFSPDGALLASGDVSDVLLLHIPRLQTCTPSRPARSFSTTSKRTRSAPFISLQVSGQPLTILCRAGRDVALVVPQRTNQLARVQCRWTALRIGLARHPRIRMVRRAPAQDDRDQERAAGRRERGACAMPRCRQPC